MDPMQFKFSVLNFQAIVETFKMPERDMLNTSAIYFYYQLFRTLNWEIAIESDSNTICNFE